MAKDHPEAPRKKTVFCFTVACFNFADDATLDSKPQQGQPDATNNRNLRRWLCWSRRLKLQKSVTKTVPVDGSPDAASTTTVVRSKTKKFSLIGSKGRHLEAERPSERRGSKAEEASEVCDGDRRVQETPTEAVHQNLSVETHVDPTESDLGNTYPPWNLRTVGKLDADRAVAVAVASTAAQPVSPDQIRPTSAVQYSAVMSPSSSSPLHLITQKPILKTDVGKKLDPVVGISVIMVTLVIMIMWGRLCAILCASVCLYFIPKFRSSEGSGGPREEGGLDMESEEYKKKVVLEGLLERNRRS